MDEDLQENSHGGHILPRHFPTFGTSDLRFTGSNQLQAALIRMPSQLIALERSKEGEEVEKDMKIMNLMGPYG